MRLYWGLALASFFVYLGAAAQTKHVEVKGSKLVIDGEAQPQLFGAEIQYFRMRGGPGETFRVER